MFIVANCSSLRQVRWTDCVVPNHVADTWPSQGFVGGMFFQRGPRRTCGTTFHLLADLDGNVVMEFDSQPTAASLLPSISKLCPDPSQLKLQLKCDGRATDFAVVRTEGIGTHRMRFHLRASIDGFHAELWATVYSFQDIVDLCGRVTWSDQSSKSDWSNNSSVEITCQTGEFVLYYKDAWDLADGESISISEPDNLYPDAMSFPFYGYWKPRYEVVSSDDPLAAFWEQRKNSTEAASEGPLVSMWSDWQGSWFQTGSIPPYSSQKVNYQQEWRDFLRYLSEYDVNSNIARPRLFASPLNTGQTGDTIGFGLTKDYTLLRSKDPRRIFQLRESTVDYLLRCHHNMEPNGAPVTFEKHPGLRTWHLAKFRTGDLLGKDHETPGDGFAFGRPFVDDEHRADLYIAAVRHVTDDPLLEADLFDRTQMDLARAFRHERWVATPRASGRLLQSWAMAWHTTWNDRLKESLHILSKDEFSLRSDQLQTNTGMVSRKNLGPVRPANVISTDARVIDGGPAWVPWNDACLLAGLWHQIALWDGAGNDHVLARDMRCYWLEVAETILRYGVVRDPSGQLFPLNGVLWLPNGETHPDSYYTFPREGASFGDDAYDMLVGTPGWFDTMGWPTVVSGYRKIGTDKHCLAIAEEIYQSRYTLPSIKTAEWLVS